jgi:transcriptional regulator with XRE-family HTH domain
MSPIRLRVREERQRRGWSQAELGRRAGVAASVINRAERGETSISLGNLEKIARALRVRPAALLG